MFKSVRLWCMLTDYCLIWGRVNYWYCKCFFLSCVSTLLFCALFSLDVANAVISGYLWLVAVIFRLTGNPRISLNKSLNLVLTVTLFYFSLTCGSFSQKRHYWKADLMNCVALCSLCRAGIDDVETDVVEIEAKLDKVWNSLAWNIFYRLFSLKNIKHVQCMHRF